MSIPGHIIFLAIISSLKAGHTSTTARFFCMYLLAGFVQVRFIPRYLILSNYSISSPSIFFSERKGFHGLVFVAVSMAFPLIKCNFFLLFLQVAVLLFICNWLVHILWKFKKDPDNYSIPYLTALGDLLGTALLAVDFYLLFLMGDRDDDLGE